jgi:hypothetical protein
LLNLHFAASLSPLSPLNPLQFSPQAAKQFVATDFIAAAFISRASGLSGAAGPSERAQRGSGLSGVKGAAIEMYQRGKAPWLERFTRGYYRTASSAVP